MALSLTICKAISKDQAANASHPSDFIIENIKEINVAYAGGIVNLVQGNESYEFVAKVLGQDQVCREFRKEEDGDCFTAEKLNII